MGIHDVSENPGRLEKHQIYTIKKQKNNSLNMWNIVKIGVTADIVT